GLIVFVGLGQTGRMTLGNTLLMYYVDDDYRGRVMSIYMMEFGLMSFGSFTAGLLTEAVGVQWALGGFAMILFCLSILVLAFVPRLRKLD
ncbi:MFS transporter, partial [Chloroflexota bacterium]